MVTWPRVCGKTREEADKLGRGRGPAEDAKDNDLVDEIGGYADAVKFAASLAALPEGYQRAAHRAGAPRAEQLALQLRMSGARLSGIFMGPAVQQVHTELAPWRCCNVTSRALKALPPAASRWRTCLCNAE